MKKEDVETIVPLLPMQQGFLWHSLKSGGNAGALHLRCTLEGDLDTTAFKQAWQAVIQQHQALRSSVHWENVKAPVQLVQKQVQPDWQEADLRAAPDWQTTLQNQLAMAQEKSLDIRVAPVFRLHLYRTGETRFELCWTLSHILLDGWSSSIVLRDVIDHYIALVKAEAKPAFTPYTLNEYTRWLKQQDKQSTLQYWQGYLPKPALCSHLPVLKKCSETERSAISEFRSSQIKLRPQQLQVLLQNLRAAGISLNTALQSAWAAQLQNHVAHEYAVFGTTVSGREIELKDAAERVGMLINLIPVAVKITANQSVKEWLSEVQNNFFASLPHAHASMQQIQLASGGSDTLFNSLLVLEKPTGARSKRCYRSQESPLWYSQ